MCGIGGIKLTEPGPIGEELVRMMTALRHRGTDSTGFALYGPWREDRLVARLRVAERDCPPSGGGTRNTGRNFEGD